MHRNQHQLKSHFSSGYLAKVSLGSLSLPLWIQQSPSLPPPPSSSSLPNDSIDNLEEITLARPFFLPPFGAGGGVFRGGGEEEEEGKRFLCKTI